MIRVAFFAGNPLTYQVALEAAHQLIGVKIIYCEEDTIKEKLAEIQKEGVQIIMGKGWTLSALQKILGNNVPFEGYFDEMDTIRAIMGAKQYLKRSKTHINNDRIHIGLIPHRLLDRDLSFYENMFDVRLSLYLVDSLNPQSAIDCLLNAKQDGVDIVCGDQTVQQLAHQFDILAISEILPPNKSTLLNNFKTALSLANHIERVEQINEDFRRVVNFSSEAIIYLDHNNVISLWNSQAEILFQLNQSEVTGRKISIFFPELTQGLLDSIIENNEPLHGHIINFKNQVIVLNIIPIVDRSDKNERSFLAIYANGLDTIETIRSTVAGNLSGNGYISKYSFDDILCQSSDMQRVKHTAMQYSQLDATVMLIGETGVGKELFAQSVHNASKRRKKPFVAINCASFPESLLESELFGYAPGAFTGASKSGKDGLFTMADKGTLFLDEISGMSLSGQYRLLRAIEERAIMRIGDTKIRSVDVRIIAASNRNLLQMVEKGTFLADLYYRLHVLTLKIPPLNSRPEDIPLLAQHFLLHYASDFRKKMYFTENALKVLENVHWKGNVRQLRYFCQRIAIISSSSKIGKDEVLQQLEYDEIVFHDSEEGHLSERETICKLLEKHHGNKSKVANELGISKTTLWRKETQYGLLDKAKSETASSNRK